MGRIQRKRILDPKNKINNAKSIQKTRKELRKEKRKQKKISKAEYYQRKNQLGKTLEKNDVQQMPLTKKQKRQKLEDIERNKKQKNAKKRRMVQLKQANLEEDKTIKHLERRLKLNKRKSKSIPMSFVSDGLDYLLDFCDLENRSRLVATEKQLLETGLLSKEVGEDLNMAIGDDTKDEYENYDEENSTDNNEDSGQDSENENLLSDENLMQVNNKEIFSEETNRINKSKKYVVHEESKTINEELNHSNVTEQSDDESLWEDIYGRKRDKKGNIVPKNYVPFAGCSTSNVFSDGEKIRRLEREMRRILNRLGEGNMQTSTKEVEEMYMSNSRNDMNVILFKLMMESIVAPEIKPDRIIREHVMLITILHANVGTDVGAHFLLAIIKKLHHMLEEFHCVENKELNNIILIISHLYNFKIYGHCLLYQILEKLAVKFSEKEIELILLILRTVAFQLKEDNRNALEKFILNLQQRAKNATVENSRVKFMLDEILAINKIPQYDPTEREEIERLKKILKSCIRKDNSVTQFNVNLEDLLEADERGKWWLVGSAWSGLKDIGKLEKNSGDRKQKYSENILELARKQRMNTDVRKEIFCILMTAEDYLDAFEKIHHLSLNNQQQKEVIYVIFNCCIQEKNFNLYYALLAQKLCDSNRKYQLTIQYALWDKLKTLDDLNTKQLTKLAKFLTYLFLNKGLSLSILKVIQFTELDKLTTSLMVQIMLGILSHENEDACLEVFERISLSPKLQTFRESLRLFIHHFLVKNICAFENLQEHSELLKKRMGLIDKLLSTRESKLIF